MRGNVLNSNCINKICRDSRLVGELANHCWDFGVWSKWGYSVSRLMRISTRRVDEPTRGARVSPVILVNILSRAVLSFLPYTKRRCRYIRQRGNLVNLPVSTRSLTSVFFFKTPSEAKNSSVKQFLYINIK